MVEIKSGDCFITRIDAPVVENAAAAETIMSSEQNIANTSAPVAAVINRGNESSEDGKLTEAAIAEFRQKMQHAVDEFHKLWYPIQGSVAWMGHELMKCPLDLWIYQEIIYECKPDLIVECGTFKGGSALFLSNICDLVHHGRVLTIDINPLPTAPLHPRLDYIIGSSVDPKTIEMVATYAATVRKVMVILDSDHTKQHVLDEMELYSNFVTPHQYLIVEDSNIHGHPVREDHPAGPWEAIEEFLSNPENDAIFKQDRMCERFLMTFNPNGYLRRIR